MKYLTYILICILFIFAIFSCSKKSDKLRIGIVQMTDDPVLDIGREGVMRALADAGFKDGENIIIDYKNAQGEISNIIMIINSFIADDVDLIITNSTPCMTAAVQNVKNIPVVFTISFSPEQTGIKNVPPNITGYYDAFMMEEFVELIKQINPNVKTIGVPLNPSEPNSVFASAKFKKEAEKNGINIIEMAVTNASEIMTVGQALAAKNIDAMVVTADNTVYLGINTLSEICIQHKIPLYVTDAFQVEKGAGIGYGLSYSDWGYKSGMYAVDILNGKPVTELPITALSEYQLLINKNFTEKIGLKFSDSLLGRAFKIIK